MSVYVYMWYAHAYLTLYVQLCKEEWQDRWTTGVSRGKKGWYGICGLMDTLLIGWNEFWKHRSFGKISNAMFTCTKGIGFSHQKKQCPYYSMSPLIPWDIILSARLWKKKYNLELNKGKVIRTRNCLKTVKSWKNGIFSLEKYFKRHESYVLYSESHLNEKLTWSQ